MAISTYVNTFGQFMLHRYGERVHKLSINAEFTCPNRDGTIGRGGCTFCNNTSFNPNGRVPGSIAQQINAGKSVIAKRTRAKKFMAYFQAYTNTYDTTEKLKYLYDLALAEPDVVGLSVGTRPDCVSSDVLDLLARYRDQGYEIWLELGLQSSFNITLEQVNRGHGFEEYNKTVHKARALNIPVCTHLMIGLPGEGGMHAHITHERVLEEGVDGLKLHPLHIVKGTQIANQWRRGEYEPWSLERYINIASELIENTPPEVVFHRLTGTASARLLLAPEWCQWKWRVINGIEHELKRRKTSQGQAWFREHTRYEKAQH
ncbi:MAG: TIGR01212 family radical SAM protein [Gammaproteobacteria bacterium]|nr:TIGR01212 family radical SAM protein [Gammaproteobacteria bacterium]MDH5592971.1 TIGR01212 family radical SAM protein [Gammaproteobacteria bacterium]